ncbi:amino acid deaminase [Arsenicitalea aurantiaca]|nr:amino acid deaminase [Arsenicitalea aurantiaca]
MFEALDDVLLDGRTKGLPGTEGALALGAVGAQGWNLLAGDVPLPAAVLKASAIANNQAWMGRIISHYGVSLAPHGKTTMAPQLFRHQIASGCWGITLSTLHQVRVARHYGISRIIIANQVLDPGFLAYLVAERRRDPDFECVHLIDSPEGIAAILAARPDAERPLDVLIEVGPMGGRTGCRTIEEALSLAREIANHPDAMRLRGIEGYEGNMSGSGQADIEARIAAFLDYMVETAEAVGEAGLFAPGEVLLTAGGSAYFDMVAKTLGAAKLEAPSRVVLRSGCYISHDSGMYARLIDRSEARSPELVPAGHPRAALEVWATVQSRPEPGLVLLNVGKRDLSYDSHLPRVTGHVPRGEARVNPVGADHEIFALNDQHAYLRCPEDGPMRPGDRVTLGISHPCTTFDKWDVLLVCDDDYRVTGAVKTFF